MKILLIGPPACGKGTVGEKLLEQLKIPLVSVGNLLRGIPKSDSRYEKIHEDMDRGQMVDEKITAEVIKERISQPDCQGGYILDGWMREMSDLKFLDLPFDVVLFLNIPWEESIKRISGRRICEEDGFACNIYAKPKTELSCEKCGGELIQRDDDREEVVRERFEVYEKDTIPVIDYYKGRGILREVNAEGTPDEVYGRVLNSLGILHDTNQI